MKALTLGLLLLVDLFGWSPRFASVHADEGTLINSGSYTGNGVDNRTVTDLGFQPDVVIIKGNLKQVAVMRTSSMTGDQTKPMLGDTAVGPNMIQNLLGDGFELGTSVRVNTSGVQYYWIAFKNAPGELVSGSYLGTGSARSITGLGFSPELVILMSEAAKAQVFQSTTMSSSFQWDDAGGFSGRMTSLDSDGFSLGTNASVNGLGIRYHYVAWNQVPGKINMGSYAGNGLDNRSITGIGFTPEYVLLKPSTTTKGSHKSESTGAGADTALNFHAAGNSTNGIQALLGDGFQVGNSSSSNGSGVTYHWIAFQQTLPSPPGSLSVDVVDGAGVSVPYPSVAFSALPFSFESQTSNGTLGTSTQKIRITNTTTNPAWTLSLAATDGSAALWDSESHQYDFNDSLSTGDDTDSDGVGGKLSIDPSALSLTSLAPCTSITGLTRGSPSAFRETAPSTSSITLVQANALASTGCSWEITGVELSQTVPASQVSGVYQISFTLTIL